MHGCSHVVCASPCIYPMQVHVLDNILAAEWIKPIGIKAPKSLPLALPRLATMDVVFPVLFVEELVHGLQPISLFWKNPKQSASSLFILPGFSSVEGLSVSAGVPEVVNGHPM